MYIFEDRDNLFGHKIYYNNYDVHTRIISHIESIYKIIKIDTRNMHSHNHVLYLDFNETIPIDKKFKGGILNVTVNNAKAMMQPNIDFIMNMKGMNICEIHKYPIIFIEADVSIISDTILLNGIVNQIYDWFIKFEFIFSFGIVDEIEQKLENIVLKLTER